MKKKIAMILSVLVIIVFFALELLLGVERPVNKTMEVENLSEVMEKINIERLFRDENGKETTFEKLDVVVLEDGRSFLIVSEITENISEEVEIVILEIKTEDGENVYDTLTDKELQKEVYKRFLKQQGIEEVQE